jgi:hypothetical protein
MKVIYRLGLLLSVFMLAALPVYADGEFCPAKPSIENGTTIATPAANATVSSPFTVSGNYFGSFEGVVPIQVLDEDGNVLVDTTAGNECCTLSPYSKEISFNVSEPTQACVVVYAENVAEGGLIPLVQVPVTLSPNGTLPGTGASDSTMGWMLLLVPVLLVGGFALHLRSRVRGM